MEFSLDYQCWYVIIILKKIVSIREAILLFVGVLGCLGGLAQSSSVLSIDCSQVFGVKFIPNPSRCDQYFQCAYGFSYLVNCPAGLHFSHYENRCVLPALAGCDRDVSWRTMLNSRFCTAFNLIKCFFRAL